MDNAHVVNDEEDDGKPCSSKAPPPQLNADDYVVKVGLLNSHHRLLPLL